MLSVASIRQFVDQYPKTIALVTLTGVGLFGVKKWMAGGVCHSKARLDGKTVLITGANTGIGKETAVDLASRGARVILACRDMDRANNAAEDIRKRSGNGNVIVKKLDLASLQSVRQLAKDILESEERLDVLINNAGVMRCPKWQTEDGFEMQFGVNHLGHFLLTDCLLDLLKKSAPSRIVNVSSLAHERGHIDFDDIHQNKDYQPGKSYAQSKLANVLFTRELATRLQVGDPYNEKTMLNFTLTDVRNPSLVYIHHGVTRYISYAGTGVTTYSLHPGVIRTELSRYFWPTMPLWRRVVFTPLMLLIKSPKEGAQTSIHCAVEESLQNESGLYYSDCAPKTAAPAGRDDEAAKRLWDLSASMVGLA